MEEIFLQIKELGEKYHAQKIILFGSRARGDNGTRSDIDIAVYGIAEDLQLQFNGDIDEQVRTLLKFDIVHISSKTNTQLLANIQKDGVIIYG